MGTGSFPWAKSGRGVTLTPHPLLVPWSRKGRAIPLFPLWTVRPVQSLSACTRMHFTILQELVKITVIPQKKTWLAMGWTVRRSNPGGGRDFPHLSRPDLGPTQPPVQWVTCREKEMIPNEQPDRPRPTALLPPRSYSKPEPAAAVDRLLMMGKRMPETCWAVSKRQKINL